MAISLMMAFRGNAAPAFAPAYGYQADNRVRGLAASASLGIAGAVGAALVLALAVDHIAPPVAPPIVASNVFIPVPPPPVDDVTPPDDRPTPIVDFTAPPPRIPMPPAPLAPRADSGLNPPADPSPFVGRDDAGASGAGDVVLPVDPPPVPDPVLRSAARDPRYAAAMQPDYPAARLRSETEGACSVRVTILATGRVGSVANAGCADDAFFSATRRHALARWRFTPATRDGVAIESTRVETVQFRITRER